MQELNASHSPLPWTYRRGPEFWEQRLQSHYIARGVNVTSTYLKYWWRAQVHHAATLTTTCHDPALSSTSKSALSPESRSSYVPAVAAPAVLSMTVPNHVATIILTSTQP